MRKQAIAALLGVIGGAASAQSTVTVYGLLDAYVGQAKSGAYKQWRQNEGGFAASQLGFRGSEDLGGGLSANFAIESGVSIDTGNGNIPGPSLAFTRQSWVGLAGNWGTLQFGRQYTPLFRSTYQPDPVGANSIFSTVILWAQTDGQTGLLPWAARADNAILYSSPSNLPITGLIMFAPGEAASPASSSGNYLGGSLAYQSGPWFAGYAFQQRKSGSATAPDPNPSTSTSQALSGSYAVDDFRLGFTYGRQSTTLPGVASATLMNLHAQYNIKDLHNLIVSYGTRDVSGSDRDQRALLLGYNYLLSKRTVLYARYLMNKNQGKSSVSLGGVPVVANSGDSLSLYGVGMMLRF